MMKIIALVIFILVQSGFTFAQDGGDIKYVKTKKLNKSFIGQFHHIDFYRKSRGLMGKRDIDNIVIDINLKPIEFVERRNDDILNSWFGGQYLESTNEINGIKIIIEKFELLEINKKEVLVLGYFNVEPYQQKMKFDKSKIVEFLFLDRD